MGVHCVGIQYQGMTPPSLPSLPPSLCHFQNSPKKVGEKAQSLNCWLHMHEETSIVNLWASHVHIYRCMHTCTHTYTYTHIDGHTHVHVGIYIHLPHNCLRSVLKVVLILWTKIANFKSLSKLFYSVRSLSNIEQEIFQMLSDFMQ